MEYKYLDINSGYKYLSMFNKQAVNGEAYSENICQHEEVRNMSCPPHSYFGRLLFLQRPTCLVLKVLK